eukprot:scpid80246/ scgid3765/ 
MENGDAYRIYCATFAFNARTSAEIDISVGDEIKVYKNERGAWPDGTKWLKGQSLSTGAQGNFPGNYTKFVKEVAAAPVDAPPVLPPKPDLKPLPPTPSPKPQPAPKSPAPIPTPAESRHDVGKVKSNWPPSANSSASSSAGGGASATAHVPSVPRKPLVRTRSQTPTDGGRPPIGTPPAGVASSGGPKPLPRTPVTPVSPPPAPLAESHQLTSVHVNKPTWCKHCQNFIWGHGKTAALCTRCGFVCHLACQDYAFLADCTAPTPSIRKTIDELLNAGEKVLCSPLRYCG